MRLLEACAHANVVRFKAACFDALEQMLMVMEVLAFIASDFVASMRL